MKGLSRKMLESWQGERLGGTRGLLWGLGGEGRQGGQGRQGRQGRII